MTLRFLEEAEAEFIAAIRWYAREDVLLAGDLASSVQERLDRAVAAPRAGRLEPRAPPRFDLRWYAVRRFPYSLLIGAVREERVVIALAHERRRPGYWLARLK